MFCVVFADVLNNLVGTHIVENLTEAASIARKVRSVLRPIVPLQIITTGERQKLAEGPVAVVDRAVLAVTSLSFTPSLRPKPERSAGTARRSSDDWLENGMVLA